MADHTVTLDTSGEITTFTLSDNFNVAVPFVDRHLDEGRADTVAIRYVPGGKEAETVTFGQLAERVNKTGNVLLDLGIEPGDRMLMIVKDCPEWFYLFWGAIKAGIVPVPLNTLLSAKVYTFQMEDSGCTALFYSPAFADQVEPALEAAGKGPRHVHLSDTEEGSLAEMIKDASSDLEPHPAKPTDDCFWLYSSGSTGTPKGAVHSQQDQVQTSIGYGVDTMGISEDDVTFSAAKLFFAYGLGNANSFPLWTGSEVILLPDRPTPDNTLKLIADFKPTIYYGVPTLYAAQLKLLESGESFDTSSLRLCLSAGEALPADLYRRWQDATGQPLIDGFGSTEALHIVISNRPGDHAPGTSGRAVSGYECKIVDEDGNEVTDTDVEGQMYIRGKSTAKFYWNNPEKTAETMIDGWLNTGDTYTRDKNGRFVYQGRNDDMLKVGGIWVSPFEIESKLIEHPKVLEAAVVGKEDDDKLTKVEAWVVCKDPGDAGDALEKELKDLCQSGLAKYKYPRWFRFVDEFPKTATGKIQRFKLRE